MLNKKLLLSLIICVTGVSCCFAKVSLNDLSAPKDPAYRVGISDIPENQYIESKQIKENVIERNIQKQAQLNKIEDNDVSYSELSIKNLSKEISADLEYEEQDMVADLSLLWQGAAMQSDTINFALYKLANPDKDKPNKNTVKKVLQTIASMSTLVGAAAGNPLLAGTSLIGGNVLGIMTQDTKALNYKYTKVTDADMIILIRKVEDLQQNAVNLYYDYMSAKKQLEMTTKLTQDRKERFELAQTNNAPKEIVVVTDAYFRSALDRQKTARSEFLSKRAALEQFVGNETFAQFERELATRQNSQKEKNDHNQENTDYYNTIENIENYTNNLDNKTASIEPVPYHNPQNVPQLRENDINTIAQTQTNETDPFIRMTLADEDVDGIDNADTKFDEKSKQDKKQKQPKQKKPKVDSHSTKGLIFIHNNASTSQIQTEVPAVEQTEQKVSKKDKKNAKTKVKTDKKSKKTSKKQSKKSQEINANTSEIPETQQQPELNYQTQQQPQSPQKTRFNGVELMPLDEIRKPDLKPYGYSIFN